MATSALPPDGTATAVFDARRRAALAALTDTFTPAVRPPAVEAHDPTGFFARRASDIGVAGALEGWLEQLLPAADLEALGALLDLLATVRFARLPQAARESVLAALSAASSDAREGLDGLRALSLQLFYGLVGPHGDNPNWAQLGYPGPPEVPPADTPRLPTLRIEPGAEPTTLRAEVVVVGSGSGGGVIAGVLASAGRDVVVLEAGPHLEADDFPVDELSAMRAMYWRGGLTPTEDGNVAIVAGATLGGGSTINWQNCVRPPAFVRESWAREHGLDGLDGADFDHHLDAVLTRISGTDTCTDLNGINKQLARAANALGWSWAPAVRNADPARYQPETAGHTGFGDRTGSKQGTLVTYLRDAADAGARIVCRAQVSRVRLDAGRAAGVDAEVVCTDGSTRALRVEAPTVVVAAGALETPAVLLRSGIGGPAVGQFLRLHPVPMITGLYDDDLRPWWGPPQATVVDAHRDVVDGYGYLVETAHLHPAITAAAVPWRSGRDHKLVMGRFARLGAFLAVTRDHGGGTVTLGDDGRAVVRYPLDDAIDVEVRRHAVRSLIALHDAAGARAILDTGRTLRLWRQGQDLAAFITQTEQALEGAGGRVLFSAHQMGSARLGTDAATSVADPDGQLHDTPGVWIGDTSAFPTAVGSNPMLTCMALAHRTAHAILTATG